MGKKKALLSGKFAKKSFTESLMEIRGGIKEAHAGPPTGAELLKIYSRGFQGVLRKDDLRVVGSIKRFRAMRAAMPRLYDIFPWAKDLGKGKLNVPYLACMELIKGWGGLFAQVQGDCTVHGNEHSAEVDYCNDCLFGETKFMGPLAFENVYRSRGFNGDGWSCEAPALYVGPDGPGGFLYRKVYEGPNGEKVDLTDYNSSWQSNGRAGVPDWLEKESAKNKAKWIIPIESMDEYRDAHAIGVGVNFCSGQAWRSSTDEFGVAAASGSWSHAMGRVASDDREWAHTKYGGMLGLIQNNWGPNWNTINGHPDGAPVLSPGSFYTKASVEARLLDGDQFAICGVWGWERVSWEAFDIGDFVEKLSKHLRNSTSQDYYKQRSEKLAEFTTQVIDEKRFEIAT